MYVGFVTHTGQRRQNQDNALVNQGLGVFAVADGVGGGDSGEVASASVCWSMQKAISSGRTLDEAIHEAHRELMDMPIDGQVGYAGSTVVAVQVDAKLMKLAWVGDSRLYLMREGVLYQLSEDHSVVQQVSGLHPIDAHRMRHVLTQAVGVAGEEGLYVESFDVERQAGDCWLLCSDGLHGVVSEDEMKQVLSRTLSAQKKAQKLLEIALGNGADDNVTIVILGDKEGLRKENVKDMSQSKEELTESLNRSPTRIIPEESSRSNYSASGITHGPWPFFLLGGVLAVLVFIVLFWGR